MSYPDIETLHAGEISDDDVRRLVALHMVAFPRPDRDVEELTARMGRVTPGGPVLPALTPRWLIVREGGRIVAKAGTWARRIMTQDGPLDVLTLAGVASAPDMRVRGFGAAVTRAVFDHVDRGAADWCLFQTAHRIRSFYEKLGCRLIDNTFVDSTNRQDPRAGPWRDEIEMVYPTDRAGWPQGEIDLLGPGW